QELSQTCFVQRSRCCLSASPSQFAQCSVPIAATQRSPGSLKLDRETLRKLGCRTLNEIIEECSHLACFFIPFFPWAEGFIMELGKQDMHLTFSNEATEILAGLTAMGFVVSRHNADWYLNCFEFSLSGPETGRSAPSKKSSRQCDMTLIK